MNHSEYLSAMLSDSISQNTISVKPKQKRNPKKHYISIVHYENDEQYFKTRITYRWSRQFTVRYENVDIYKSEEYSWLINSYENRSNFVRGIDVEFEEAPTEKATNKTTKKKEVIAISDEIFIDLPEVHYINDPEDKELFRMRNIQFNILNICPNSNGIHWVQNQNRPALYVDSVDLNHKFDGNSILMYINSSKAKRELASDIENINNGSDSKSIVLGKFVGHLFAYTMMLYYINVSHGWKFEDITYNRLWELGMYFLSCIKPFDENNDWLRATKISYLKFLFSRKASNELSKGIKHYYRKLAEGKLIKKESRYRFPDQMSKLDRAIFKEMFSKPKTNHQEELERRNQSIIEDHKLGLSIRKLSSKYGLSTGCIHKVINA